MENCLWKSSVLTKMQAECLQSFYKQQPSRDVPVKRCSEYMQQSYRITPTPMKKGDFNKVEITIIRAAFYRRAASENISIYVSHL